MNGGRVAILVIPLLALLAVACDSQTIVQTGEGVSHGISVSGTGRVVGVPDVVQLQMGVQVTAPSVEAARDQAARAQQAVIDALKAGGVQERDIQTIAFSVRPQYDFPGGVQTLRGFQVSNTVSAKIRRIEEAGRIIDQATRAGGDRVQVRSISFSIDDPSELQSRARERAVEDARKRAEALARHAGVRLGRPLLISETSGAVPELPLVIAPRTGDATTPIQPGELEIVVNVSIVFAID